jgi:type II secretory pathway predicted ATPase ExeA
MYETHYQLREKPFTLLPDPDFLMLTRQHNACLSELRYGLNLESGITILTGEAGCGKTTLVRHLLRVLDDDVTVGLIAHTQDLTETILGQVLSAFGQPGTAGNQTALYERITQFLSTERGEGRHAALIVDEAQHLGIPALEALRAITDENAGGAHVLRLVLVGMPGIRETLRNPDMQQFAQRIVADCQLYAFDSTQTADYIAHRLRIAGGNPKLFEPTAVDLIHAYSRGVPRLINVLCDTALVYAFGSQTPVIGAQLIRQVIEDRGESGLLASIASTQARSNVNSELSRFEPFAVRLAPTQNAEAFAYVHRSHHISCSQAYAEIFGYRTTEELAKVTPLALVSPEYRTLVRKHLEPGTATGTLLLNGVTQDQSLFPIALEFHPAIFEGRQCFRLVAKRIDPQAVLSTNRRP